MEVVTKPRLLDEVRHGLRRHHCSVRTEKSYLYWIRFYIRFAGRRHPHELGPEESERFLTWLATVRRVAASRQNQALSALLFLYRRVFRLELPQLGKFERAKRPVHLPTGLTREEVRAVVAHLDGSLQWVAHLLYGRSASIPRSAAAADKGSRFRTTTSRRKRRQGCEESHGHAAGACDSGAQPSLGKGSRIVCTRSRKTIGLYHRPVIASEARQSSHDIGAQRHFKIPRSDVILTGLQQSLWLLAMTKVK